MSLYADDVVMFCHPTSDDVAAVKAILQIFGISSGLLVNYNKSSAALLHCTPADATAITNELGCPIVELPMTYLGIPLTIRRPISAQLQAVVERVADQLPSWKTGLMNKTGWLALVKSVLCAIPIHQLLVYAPAKKIIKQLEKICRGFLWTGRANANGDHCHVNWRRVCRPIALGGLSVTDIECAGLALRLRWQRLSRTDPARAWSGLELQFSSVERALFFASTHMVVGNGLTAKFWEDRWLQGRSISEIAPQLYACVPKRR